MCVSWISYSGVHASVSHFPLILQPNMRRSFRRTCSRFPFFGRDLLRFTCCPIRHARLMISNFDHYLGGNSHVLQVRPCNPELKSPRPLQGRVTLRRKTILFSGDQRQVCPVLKSATETKIVDHAFLSASMWQHVERFRLTVSMSAKDEIPFAKPVLQSGGRRGQDRTRLTTRWFSCYPFETPSLTAAVLKQNVLSKEPDYEHLIDTDPDLLEVNHNTYNDRRICRRPMTKWPHQRFHPGRIRWSKPSPTQN